MKRWWGIRHIRWVWLMLEFNAHMARCRALGLGLFPQQSDLDYLDDVWHGIDGQRKDKPRRGWNPPPTQPPPPPAPPKPEMIGTEEATNRGFQLVRFEDTHGNECTIQQSSGIDGTGRGVEHPGSSYLWIGVEDPKPLIPKSRASVYGLTPEPGGGFQPYPVPREVTMATRMHLNREQVKTLIARLEHWLHSYELFESDKVSH